MITRFRARRASWRALAFHGALALAASAGTATACDICAVYAGTELRERRPGPELAVGQQFSRFTTLRQGGDEVSNPQNERLESSITQLVAAWSFTPRFAARVAAPMIVRTFRRSAGHGVERGREWGPGDVALLGEANVWSLVTDEMIGRLTLTAGVELPTGDSDRLGEEAGEEPEDGADAIHGVEDEHGHEHGGGIHAHDLALGSGSFDGLFGARAFLAFGRWFASGSVQYALRTEGDFDYRYADDLTWSGGPGFFLVARHDRLLGLQASLVGETKGKDSLRGEPVHDTAITSLYAGPALFITSGSDAAVEVAADLPVLQHNTGLQIVPDWRIRGGLSLRFR